MTTNDWLQIGLYMAVLLALVKPLGTYMAWAFSEQPNRLTRFGGGVERLIYKICGIRADEEMNWKRYSLAMLVFNVVGLLAVYALQRTQQWHGALMNPQHLPAVSPDSSFNTAVSFITNTNWQGYGGESTMSYLTQMAGLGVQNFLSAATGIAILIALIRGFTRRSAKTIGSFWVDMTRSTLYVLLPLSLVLALLLVSQGVVQNFSPYKDVPLLQPTTITETVKDAAGNAEKDAHGKDVTKQTTVTTQSLPLGPAASQIAIKQMGTNGGGFFNVNARTIARRAAPPTRTRRRISVGDHRDRQPDHRSRCVPRAARRRRRPSHADRIQATGCTRATSWKSDHASAVVARGLGRCACGIAAIPANLYARIAAQDRGRAGPTAISVDRNRRRIPAAGAVRRVVRVAGFRSPQRCVRLGGLPRASQKTVNPMHDSPDQTSATPEFSAAEPTASVNGYDPRAVEAAAQAFWARTHAFDVVESDPRPKYYCLSMLPYPSGALHVGHLRNYTIGDVISRYQRMQGKNVLQPLGWDAFGLPAENAAIKNKTAPATWTYANIEHMRGQLATLGYAIDWTREFATCKPDYYIHEQRMFVRLFKKGLAYRKNSVVNWDPVDQTVLANEQVIDGRGWRTGALVEKREIPQWFLRITAYAQELLDGLDTLPGWPDSVKTMQRNWIGRSEGIDVSFALEGDAHGCASAAEGRTPGAAEAESLTVFTTRPDTLMGVTFLSIAAEHPLALRVLQTNPEVAVFVDECRHGGTAEAQIETQEKKGVFTGLYASHPISGERVPIWVANFVLMGYGTGAAMAVPGHDQRDWEFAQKYDLPIVMVVVPPDVRDALREISSDVARGADVMQAAFGRSAPLDVYDTRAAVQVVQEFQRGIAEQGAWTERGTCVNSGDLDGMDFEQAFAALATRLGADGRGAVRVNFRLRDWGVSRQRYWGCPIPIIYCAKCGAVPMPEDQLPVVLPEDIAFMGQHSLGAGSPIKSDPEWRKTPCPQCGGAAERETDTFDTFMESSWYYARYTSPGATDMVDARAQHWLPVDQYIGGIEHAILHLLYFRFFHKLMRDEGLVQSDEPATNLLCQGMVIAETFYRESPQETAHGAEGIGNREWFNPADIDIRRDEKGRIVGALLKADGKPVEIGGTEKMSKSKNNGVDPQIMVNKYGADTVRLFSMFAAPPEQSLEWNEAGVEGMARFLRRLWREVHAHALQNPPLAQQGEMAEGRRGSSIDPHAQPAPGNERAHKVLRRQLHEVIDKVGDDLGRRLHFNTAIASLMELLNALGKFNGVDAAARALRQEAFEAIVLLLNPITPHLSHALWQTLGHAETLIEDLPWPKSDATALQRDNATLAVQVNGKLRGTIYLPVDTPREAIEAAALADPNVAKFLEGQTVKKLIVVPGKIVNIVASA